MQPRVEHCFSSEDGTLRFLIRLADEQTVESVFIPRRDRSTLCISSQVGCGLGCRFCLTGQLGFIRNLTTDEMLAQVLLMLEDPAQRFSVVFMGMGEPLQNYESVMKAIRFMHDDRGLRLPMSRITVSTAGLIPQIERLSHEPLFPNLCISVTGVTDRTRDKLMPINHIYPVDALMDVVRALPLQRRKRVMLECVMIRGLTDSPDDAEALARALRGARIKVNLIPLNPAEEIPFEPSVDDAVLRFHDILVRSGTAAFIRKNRGRDVSGACGQLKNKIPAGSIL